MTSRKAVGFGVLLALLWSQVSTKKSDSAPNQTPAPPKDKPSTAKKDGLPKRPNATKEPQETPVATDVLNREEGREIGRKADQQGKAQPKPKPPKKAIARGDADKREDNAAELAERMHKDYIDRGELPEAAAADALALYLMAGGSDRRKIAEYQKIMGVKETGEYDIPTAGKISELLHSATDAAIAHYLFMLRLGESPDYAAADALSVYVREVNGAIERGEIATLPGERVAALQMQFMVPSGKYDEKTKEEMIRLGVFTP